MLIVYKLLKMAVLAALIAPKDEPFEVEDFESGAKTQVETMSISLVEDEAAWRRVWTQHQGPIELDGQSGALSQPPPKVDFAKSMVLAFFAGNTSNIGSFEVVEADGRGEKAVIKLRPISLPSGDAVLMTPYAFIQVTRTKKPVQLQVAMPDGRFKVFGEWKPKVKDKRG